MPITLAYASDLTDAQIMLNTTLFGTLYSAGKIQSDCDDLRFTDAADVPLTFYTEVCDTSGGNSIVWVTADVTAPSSTIYMFYGNSGADSASETWTGKMYALFGTLPDGWTDDLSGSYAGYYPYGSSTFGDTGGAATHTHTASWSISATTGTSMSDEVYPSGSQASLDTHTHTFATSPSFDAANNAPAYRDMIFGYKASFQYNFPNGAVVMFNGTIPSGWTQYTDLSDRAPRIASSAGTTGGSNVHTHAINTGTLAASSENSEILAGSGLSLSRIIHTHGEGSEGASDSVSSLPEWFGVVFITHSTSGLPLHAGSVLLFDTLPPQGWTLLSGADSRLLYGQDSFGGTGGSNTHPHTSATATSGTDAESEISKGSTAETPVALKGHTHIISGSSISTESHVPLYHTFLLGQRKATLPTVTFQTSQEENVATVYTTIPTTVTSVTSQTSTVTTQTTQTFTSTSLTQPPGFMGGEQGVVSLSIASTWQGVVNQTQVALGQVSVTGSGPPGTVFSITDVAFSAETPWITLNETKSAACGCYKVFQSMLTVPIRFRVAPGLDVPPNTAYHVSMLVAGVTQQGLRVTATSECIVVTVYSAVPSAVPYVQPPVDTQTLATGLGVAFTIMTLVTAVARRRKEAGVT